MDGGMTFERFARNFNTKLEPPVKKHLKNVYGTFSLATVLAGVGGFVDMYGTILGAGLLSGLGAFGLLITLMMTPHDEKKTTQRLALLSGFAFLSGLNMGPLLQLAAFIEPMLIFHALVGTSIVFACFSLCSIYAPRGQYLYLGGILSSLLSTLFWLSLMNLFFGSRLLFQVNIYLGLAMMCGFVVYDTQLIIEKSRNGERDYIMHSVLLFIDFIAIFKRILIILMDKESQNKKKRKN